MEENRKERLAWFVQFANLNIKELRAGDKAKLMIEAEEYLFPTEKEVNKLKSISHFVQADPRNHTPLLMMRDVFSQITRWIQHPWPEKDSTEYWQLIEDLQDTTKQAFHIFLKEANWDFTFLGIGGYGWERGEQLSFTFYPVVGSHWEYLFHKILILFDGVPDTAIRKCLSCGKYFFNPTLREKKFCSSLCMWRHNAEKQRDKDRDAYNKKQREIMRKRYKERMAKETGFSKLKIQNRPARKGE